MKHKKVKVRAIHPKVSPEEKERVFDCCYNILEKAWEEVSKAKENKHE